MGYIAIKALLNTKRVNIIDKKECCDRISIKHTDFVDILSLDNTFEFFKNTYLDLVG